MTPLTATVQGIGFWANGLPDWAAARADVLGAARVDGAPARPSPQLLAPNERRRAPDTVALALDVALAACEAAGRAPQDLPSIFASTHGDLGITDYMCSTLAENPRAVSPTRFHNSVHNAAAGYWTIGAGCTQSTTALSAYDATFAEGLIEALVQLHAGQDAVLLVGYDGHAGGPLGPIARSEGLLGGALVLSSEAHANAPRISVDIVPLTVEPGHGRLTQLAGRNAMAPMLPLFEALALGGGDVVLQSGQNRAVRVRISVPSPAAHGAPVAAGALDG